MRSLTIHAVSAGQDCSGVARVAYCRPSVAIKRALLCMGLIWCMAGIGLLLPLMQVVLPPAFFVAGFFVAAFVYLKTRGLPQTLEGEVPCLHCGRQDRFQFENVRPPFYSMCRSCKTGYRILWPPKNGERISR